MKLNDNVYNVLKWVVMIAIPAVTTFLATVLPVCGVPDSVIRGLGIILPAIATLIGTLIGISTFTYNTEDTAGNVDDDDKE